MMDSVNNILVVVGDRDIYLVLALCTLCALMLRELIGSTLTAVAMIPCFWAVSLYVLYFFRKHQVLVSVGEDQQVVAASGIGVTLAFISLALIFDLLLGVTDWRVRSMLKRRKLDPGSR